MFSLVLKFVGLFLFVAYSESGGVIFWFSEY